MKWLMNILSSRKSLCTLFRILGIKVQHRMRPEISDLVRDTIYKDLQDHSSVHQFPAIRGIERSLFFITHNQMEKSVRVVDKRDPRFEIEIGTLICIFTFDLMHFTGR